MRDHTSVPAHPFSEGGSGHGEFSRIESFCRQNGIPGPSKVDHDTLPDMHPMADPTPHTERVEQETFDPDGNRMVGDNDLVFYEQARKALFIPDAMGGQVEAKSKKPKIAPEPKAKISAILEKFRAAQKAQDASLTLDEIAKRAAHIAEVKSRNVSAPSWLKKNGPDA